jgi:hypothetical protein
LGPKCRYAWSVAWVWKLAGCIYMVNTGLFNKRGITATQSSATYYLCGNFPCQIKQSWSTGLPSPSHRGPGIGISSKRSLFSVTLSESAMTEQRLGLLFVRADILWAQ